MSAAERLVMPNDLQEIQKMTDFVRHFGNQHSLAEEDIFAFTVCLEELISNTINYGCRDGLPHEIMLDLSLSGSLCRASLNDNAMPFDPLQRHDVDTSLPLEEKPIGGLGIHMVKKMMSRVDYELRGGRNHIIMERRVKTESKDLLEKANPVQLPPSTFSSGKNTPSNVLLITDCPATTGKIRNLISEEQDIQLLVCNSAEEALNNAASFDPGVVLQNLTGPAKNLESLQALRSAVRTQAVPVLFLSEKSDPATRSEAFTSGANDYLDGLPDKTELLSKLRYHSRSHFYLKERDQALLALEAQQKALSKELGDASGYVSSLFPAPIKEDRGISADWRFIPSSSLGGDTFSYLWLDENRFILELLDVCGHGVGAALLSVSVINTLRARNATRDREARPPSEVLSSLNKSFPMENNNQMYFTMWFGIFDIRTRELTYSSGGHPPAIVLMPDGSIHLLATPGLMVGAMPESVYTQKTITLPRGTRLFLFSDGCYEVRKQENGELMSLVDFTEVLRQPGQTLDQVITEIRRIQGSSEFVDDFSLVEFQFS